MNIGYMLRDETKKLFWDELKIILLGRGAGLGLGRTKRVGTFFFFF
jgi:hypothetical protein